MVPFWFRFGISQLVLGGKIYYETMRLDVRVLVENGDDTFAGGRILYGA